MKTEVYSWRVSAHRKAELESEALREGVSLARLLEDISTEWLNTRRTSDETEQAAIRKRAMAAIGSIAGGDPHRSSQTSERVKEILRKKYGRQRAD